MHNPTYEDVFSRNIMPYEVVRVEYDHKECSYLNLLDVFWAHHDPTTLNLQEIKLLVGKVDRQALDASIK